MAAFEIGYRDVDRLNGYLTSEALARLHEAGAVEKLVIGLSADRLAALPVELLGVKSLVCTSALQISNLLYDLTALEELDCSNNPHFNRLPAGLTRLRKLVCRNTSVRRLPGDLVALEELDCSECVGFKRLVPDEDAGEGETEPGHLSRLRTLKCGGTALTELPGNLGALEELDCSECPDLVRLAPEGATPDHLSRLRTLNCSYTHIASIPSAGALEELNCEQCDGLTELPADLPNLRALNCAECAFAGLPDTLTNLESLDCSLCPNLAALPNGMRRLETLRCGSCPALAELPGGLVRVSTLVCSYCPLLRRIPREMVALRILDIQGTHESMAVPGAIMMGLDYYTRTGDYGELRRAKARQSAVWLYMVYRALRVRNHRDVAFRSSEFLVGSRKRPGGEGS